MTPNKPKSPKRNQRRKKNSGTAGNQTTISIENVNVTVNCAPNEPPPGNQRDWFAIAVEAILRVVLIIALFWG